MGLWNPVSKVAPGSRPFLGLPGPDLRMMRSYHCRFCVSPPRPYKQQALCCEVFESRYSVCLHVSCMLHVQKSYTRSLLDLDRPSCIILNPTDPCACFCCLLMSSPSLSLSLVLQIHTHIRLPIYLSIYLTIYLFIYLSLNIHLHKRKYIHSCVHTCTRSF